MIAVSMLVDGVKTKKCSSVAMLVKRVRRSGSLVVSVPEEPACVSVLVSKKYRDGAVITPTHI